MATGDRDDALKARGALAALDPGQIRLFHIEQAHQTDTSGSKFLDGISPIDLLGELASRLPAEVIYAQREARLEFQRARPAGVDIVEHPDGAASSAVRHAGD